VDTEKGSAGRPESTELIIGETTKRWMTRELKPLHGKLPKGTTSVGLMRECIIEYGCTEDSCKDVESHKSCSCRKSIQSNWKAKVNELLVKDQSLEKT
jgi:hypothetical protein